MMDIFNMLGGMGNAQQQISQQTGATPQQSESAMEAAIPLLLGAMTRNASSPDGAASLAGALGQHDGSALEQFSRGSPPNLQEGQKILGHVFGNQQQSAASAVSKRAGIDPQLAMQILSMAAPLVLGYLARQRQQGGQQGQGRDIGGLLGGLWAVARPEDWAACWGESLAADSRPRRSRPRSGAAFWAVAR